MSRVTKVECSIKSSTEEKLPLNIIKERLDDIYGWSFPIYSVAKEWAKRFRTGQESLEESTRSGRPGEMIKCPCGRVFWAVQKDVVLNVLELRGADPNPMLVTIVPVMSLYYDPQSKGELIKFRWLIIYIQW